MSHTPINPRQVDDSPEKAVIEITHGANNTPVTAALATPTHVLLCPGEGGFHLAFTHRPSKYNPSAATTKAAYKWL